MKKFAASLALVALGTAALAHSGVQNKDVMARMVVMSTIGDQMKILGAMAKGETPFDAAAANAAVLEVAAQTAQIAPMFETRADDPKSEALPLIWEDWEGFVAVAADAEAKSEALVGTITAEADLGPALGELGGTCKACHSKYRE